MKNKLTSPGFLNPPFQYPGSQTYALETLLPLMPAHFNYAEPFCGGASTFFGKIKVKENWLNDIDRELIKTYQIIRDQPEKFMTILSHEENSLRRYNYFKSEFTPQNDFDIAIRWFYLNKTSHIENMNMAWEYDSRIISTPIDWCNEVEQCSEKLQNVKLTSDSFEIVLNNVPDDIFLFMSPPYSIHHLPNQTNLYKHPFKRESHFLLANILKSKKNNFKFLLTYNDNDEIKKMYSWEGISIIDLPNKYPKKAEIAIINYEV